MKLEKSTRGLLCCFVCGVGGEGSGNVKRFSENEIKENKIK